ncbi:MAG: Cna B-type domain-containing protein [Atopobiaceae bacterium]|nr:Cna B-type domain-containing protein [Atopobiaceae bacterium]
MSKVTQRIAQAVMRNRKTRNRRLMAGALGIAVLIISVAFIVLPAFTITGAANCGMLEHRHEAVCYTRTRICGMEEGAQEDGTVHTHTDECYANLLTCGLPEHVHTVACNATESEPANEETKPEWEKDLPAFAEGTPRIDRLLQITRAQRGTRESEDDYVIENDVFRGYTKYGAWAGDPYMDWNTTFLGYCLTYAGIGEDVLGPMPDGDNAVPWQVRFENANQYVAAYDPNAGEDAPAFVPSVGDVVFLGAGVVTDEATSEAVEGEEAENTSEEVPEDEMPAEDGVPAEGEPVEEGGPAEKGEPIDEAEPAAADDLRVAIVTAIDAKAKTMTIVEGDVDGVVAERKLPLDAPEIRGYGTMPSVLREEREEFARRKHQEDVRRKEAEAEAEAAQTENAQTGANKAQVDAEAEHAEPAALPEPAGLWAEGDGYRVETDLVGWSDEGFSLRVQATPVTENRIAAIEEGLSEELPNGARKQAHVDASNVEMLDIAVLDPAGNVVEPDALVHMTVTRLADKDAPAPADAKADAPKGQPAAGEPAAGEAAADDSPAPEVVHLTELKRGTTAEALDAEAQGAKGESFTFVTDGFSPFAFVYTVDFAYEGYAWSMPGGGSMWLSDLFEKLGVSVDIATVTDVTFSNPELVQITPAEDASQHDWLLKSLVPFDSEETLTLALADGSSVVIAVTDEGEDAVDEILDEDHQDENPNIRRLLDRVQFFDGDVLVGDSTTPDSMVVRPGHEYTMRLEFSEDEDENPDVGQLPDDGFMYYGIPDGVYLSTKAFHNVNGEWQIPFSIVLDRKHTLENNIVTYVPAEEGVSEKAYLKIQWNKDDAANYKLLKASPRTTFMLGFPYTTIQVDEPKDIVFSDSAVLSVDPDPTFDVTLEKTSRLDEHNKELIEYEVTAVADGNVENITCNDVMGAALTYVEGNDGLGSGVTITYMKRVGEDETGKPIYEAYDTLPAEYAASNVSDFHVAEGNHGFDFKLRRLNGGDMALIKYSAHIDYTKLGGKNNIETTSKNTVTAKDSQDNLLDEASSNLDKNIDYLQIGKRRDAVEYVKQETDEHGDTSEVPIDSAQAREGDWTAMYVKWQVIYNPDHLINVEGATLKDSVWMGKKYSTSYVTDDPARPFKVTAYSKGSYEKDSGAKGDTFTPEQGDQGTDVIVPSAENGYGWNDLDKNTVSVTEPNSVATQLATWEWTIPQKSASGLDADKPYTYVVEYWTKIDKTDPDDGGYVGNQVTENIADITRDKAVELPGPGPGYDITVNKEHIIDEYTADGKVYTNWEISFDRRDSAQERALVEDTLPHIMINDEKGEHVCTDRFVDSEGPEKYQMTVTGLYDETGRQEQCVPSISADGYDVVFWFFKNKTPISNPNINTPGQGLFAADPGMTDAQKKITISFWTENDKEWIEATANGKATNEHWNHVHLVLNGKEAVDKTYAVPKPASSIKKSVETVGSWTDGNTTLPVYRYTLTLSGLNDDLFGPKDREGNHLGDTYTLNITDEYNNILEYLPVSSLPAVTGDKRDGTITGTTNEAINGKHITIGGSAASDEVLIRPVPQTNDVWPAQFSGLTEGSDATKEKLEITISMSDEDRQKMKYQVKAEDGTDLIDPDSKNPVRVYGRSYEVSYYMAPNFEKVKQTAQTMVNNKDTTNTTLTFSNEATWENTEGEAGENTFTASTGYNLNPVQKQLVSYDEKSELATYSIDVNPLMLKMNNGQRYAIEDMYTNLAVDFQTVQITTYPPGRESEIEWSYHSNKGTFWVPDETRVSIRYEGWPVGRRGTDGLTFSNTAAAGLYSDPENKQIDLKVDHEGYASTYHVRIFKFADDNMEKPLEGAVFQLFENDASGNIVPMTYKVDHSAPIEDDAMWSVVNAGRVDDDTFPTPENHKAGDKIYFVTGNGTENSAQKGFADVMLSQSRDGVALKKNKQYYLREVKEPNGHIKENIDWRFIIGENDDWDSYVYSDDSILQVSNTSLERVLTVRKTFVDRTASQRITYDAAQKNVQFEIKGTASNDSSSIVYNKIVPYENFMAVDTPQDNGTTKREWLLIISKLPAGNYTVRELNTSAKVDGAEVSTSVTGQGSVTRVDSEGRPKPAQEGDDPHFDTGKDDTTGDIFCTFTVPASDDMTTGEHTKTSVEAEFTNIYTDENPVSITVSKAWNNGGKNNFVPKKAEFELRADGVKYALTKADGAFVNDRGNIVVDAGSGDAWLNEVTVQNLPRKKVVTTNDGGQETSVEQDIVWTVEEVGATYRTDTNSALDDTTVTGMYLEDHFTTVQNTTDATGQDPAKVSFTNTFNNLTSVEVKKTWSDTEAGVTNHENDVVFFDLYRTTTNISGYTEDQLRALVGNAGGCELVRLPDEDTKLSYNSDSSKSFTYSNHLLEKVNNSGDKYYYFALERSVAGYEDAYPSRVVTGTSQSISITNTPIQDDPRGTLTLQKTIAGTNVPTNLDKTYKFTLWNSGKYLVYDKTTREPNDVKLVPEEQATETERTFTVRAGETLTLSGVKLGTYELTEIEDTAQIGGYKLTSTTVAVNGAAAASMGENLTMGVQVEADPTTVEDPQNPDQTTTTDNPTNVVVTNTYEKDESDDAKTDYTFGKLWVMPDTEDTTALAWPDKMTTTMQLGRRIKGTTTEDQTFAATYTFAKDTGYTITATPGSGAPAITINNPDDPQANGGSAGGNSSGQGLTPGGTPGETNTDGTGYHHYTFTVKGLEKYDANGNEWEYFAKETAVTEATDDPNAPNNMQDKNNPTGRYFTEHYGVVDGIGARILGDEQSDTGVGVNGHVGYAINRLDFTQQISIPVKKIIDGRFDLAESDEELSNKSAYPPFTFGLYDVAGHAITVQQGSASIPVTKTTDETGHATFDITELVNLNDMMWWSDEQVLTGRYNFWVKELRPYAGQLAPLEYNGVTFTSDSAKVSFYVRYNWQTGEFSYVNAGEETSSATPQMNEVQLVNKYDTGKVKLTVKKHWDDENNRDGYRKPAKFKVNAYYYADDGTKVDLDNVWLLQEGANGVTEKNEIDLNDLIEVGTKTDDQTTITFPKFYEGHLIYYTVDEQLDKTTVTPAEGQTPAVTLDDKYDAEHAVAKIGNVYYDSLRVAVAAASASDTIDLIADDSVSFAVGETIAIDKSLTIRGNGHTIHGSSNHCYGIGITGNNTVTIENATLTGFGDKASLGEDSYAPIYADANFNGTLNLTGLTISNFNREGIVINGGSFAIDGCTVLGNNDQRAASGGSPSHFQQPIEIRGGSGTISGTTVRTTVADDDETNDRAGIVSSSSGSVTLTNVDVDVVGIGVDSKGGTVTVDGPNTHVSATDRALYAENGGTLNVSAGTYIGNVATDNNQNSKIAISGGEFSNEVEAAHCATGYIPSGQLANGMWTVVSSSETPPTIIDVPAAASGLVYNGGAQTGVSSGTGYTVQDGAMTNAGEYNATVTPDAGYAFADGPSSKSVPWSIEQAPVTVKADNVTKVADATDPNLTATVTGTFGSDTVSYTITRTEGADPGVYTIVPAGDVDQGNYTVTYVPGTFTILPSDQESNDAVAYTVNNGTITMHATLQGAINAASGAGGHTVHLVKDVALDGTLSVDNRVIIDGAGHTISPSTSVTLESKTANPLIGVSSTGDLTLANVTIDADNKARAIKVSGGKLTLNDGAIVTKGTTADSFIGGVYMTGKSEFTMNGGTITGNSVSSAYVNDGYLQYSADLWIGSEAKGTMNGGTVGNLFVNSNDFSKPAAGFTQNGGTITNAYLEYDKGKMSSLTHNGGGLSNLVIAQDDANGDNHVSTPTTVNSPADGMLFTAGSSSVRVEGDSGARYFNSFEDAVSDAQSGETITLLANATLSNMIQLGKDLNINLNGHTLSAANDTAKAFEVANNATLTIDGTAANSAFVGGINVGTSDNNNGNLVLNGGTYSCGGDQTVVQVNDTCRNSNVTITGATITSPNGNGIQLDGAGEHHIKNSTISGSTAVYLKSGALDVEGSTLTSTANTHTDYSDSGSNPTGDAIVVASGTSSVVVPRLVLGEGNAIGVDPNSGNVAVGYYTSDDGQPGTVTSMYATNNGTTNDGYAWVDQGDGTYAIAKVWTVSFDPVGGVLASGQSASGSGFGNQQVADGWKATRPSNPTRAGKAFIGWYDAGGHLFDFEQTQITADTRLTAKWQDVPSTPTDEPYYTNKHVPEAINVSVEKKWDDDNTTSRRAPVTMRLKATYTNEAGSEVEVTHASLATNSSSPWYTYLEKFVDITLTDGSSTPEDANDDWKNSTTWVGLPRYAPGENGKLVTYTVEELPDTIPLGYYQVKENDADLKTATTAERGGTAENVLKNKYESIDIPLKKIWNDDSDRDGLRSGLTSVTMNLSAAVSGTPITMDSTFTDGNGNVVVTSKDVTGTSASNEWVGVGWTKLPKYYRGEEITYTVAENPVPLLANYTASGSPAGTATPVAGDAAGTRAVTNSHVIERTQLGLKKIWEDNTNQDGKRPDVATYVKNFVRLTAAVGGNTTNYAIGANPIQGTTNQYYLYAKNNDGTLGNQYRVEGEQLQPTAVLYGNHHHGADDYDYVITFQNLPSNAEHGTSVVYGVEETDAEGHVLSPETGATYTNLTGDINGSDYSMYEIKSIARDDTTGNYTITNSYEPDVIHVKATKSWISKTGQNLTAEHIAALSGQVRFKLVARENNNVVDMSTWRMGLHHHYYVEPEQSLTSKSLNNGGVEWCAEWDNLPKHDPAGVEQEIVYTVEEVQCPDYYHLTSDAQSLTVPARNYADKTTANVTVANTYEDVTVTATKNWDDDNNQDGMRKPVTFQLQESADKSTWSDVTSYQYNGATVSGATTIGTLDNLVATWEGLPAWKNNARVYYRAVEVQGTGADALSGYTTTEGAFANPSAPAANTSTYEVADTITNAHTSETRSAAFTKRWNHKGASNYLSPAEYLSKLHLYWRVQGSGNAPQEVLAVSPLSPDPALFLNTDETRDNNWRGSGNPTQTVGTGGLRTATSGHTTVKENADGTYAVTVQDLPVNKPKASPTATSEPLEYFITEDEIENYTPTYPTREAGSTLPANMVAEGETLLNTRDTGGLIISKAVESDLASDASKDFTFTITANPPITESHYPYMKTPSSGAGSTGTLTFDEYGKTSVTLKQGETIQIKNLPNLQSDIDGLPVGVTYTVAETASEVADYNTAYVVSDTVHSVENDKSGNGTSCQCVMLNQHDEVVTAAFTNTRKLGSLAISKDIVSPVTSDHNKKFKLRLVVSGLSEVAQSKMYGDVQLARDATDNTGVAVLTLGETAAGQNESVTLSDLPVGATYAITEIANDDADGISLDKFNTTWVKSVAGIEGAVDGAGVAFPGEQALINTVTDDATSVAFTNARKTGQLKLTKTVLSPFASETGASYDFVVNLHMPAEGYGGEAISGTFNATAVTDGKVTFTNGVATVPVAGSTGATGGARHDVVISGLPIDAEYTVAEANPDASIFEEPVVSYKGVASDSSAGTPGAGATSPYAVATEGATYGVEVTNTRKEVPVSMYKVSSVNGAKLGGAEFTMTRVDEQDNPVTPTPEGESWPKQLVSDATTGCFVERVGGSTSSTQAFVLKPGRYKLEETKAPTGYHPLKQPAIFTVLPTGVVYTDSIAENRDSVVIHDNADKTKRLVDVNVSNSTGVELPSTGGEGLMGLYAAGCVLLLLAFAAARARRRWAFVR